MGEAKRRGSFEQRKAEGEERLQLEAEQRRKEEARREAALTPEQRKKRVEARKLLTMMAGFTAGSLMR